MPWPRSPLSGTAPDRSSVVAQSRHSQLSGFMSAFGRKADIEPLMSANYLTFLFNLARENGRPSTYMRRRLFVMLMQGRWGVVTRQRETFG